MGAALFTSPNKICMISTLTWSTSVSKRARSLAMSLVVFNSVVDWNSVPAAMLDSAQHTSSLTCRFFILKSFYSCTSTPCDSSLSTAFESISRFPMIRKLFSKCGLMLSRPAIKVSSTACRSSWSNVLMIRSLCSPFELLNWYRSLYAFSLPFSIYLKRKPSSNFPSMTWFANTQKLSLLANDKTCSLPPKTWLPATIIAISVI